MPQYLFRRAAGVRPDLSQHPLINDVEKALATIGQQRTPLRADFANADFGRDECGERVSLRVGSLDDVGWEVEYANILKRYGVRVSRSGLG